MDIDDRIAQWEKMTQEAPDDMAWLGLGSAYKEAGRLADADQALSKAIQLNPDISRAYQMRGQVLVDLNRHEDAAQMLTAGYAVAARRGDLMPQKAIISLLEQIGHPVPAVEQAQRPTAPASSSANTVIDRLTGRPGTRMSQPPLRGPLGAFIVDHFSQETWRQWIGQGTKVINELRLDFSNQEHQHIYEQQMKQWLQISDQEIEAYGTDT